MPTEPGGPKITDWAKADHENIFTTNASKSGWCNVDPNEAYASKVKFKEECDCKYDCLWGQFCEIPTICSCLNQCSGHGHCRGGFCQVYNEICYQNLVSIVLWLDCLQQIISVYCLFLFICSSCFVCVTCYKQFGNTTSYYCINCLKFKLYKLACHHFLVLCGILKLL